VHWADYLDALAAQLKVRRPWRVPTWTLRAIPYLHTVMTTSIRVSNAKAKRERAQPGAGLNRPWLLKIH
jgi:hypothetical protein